MHRNTASNLTRRITGRLRTSTDSRRQRPCQEDCHVKKTATVHLGHARVCSGTADADAVASCNEGIRAEFSGKSIKQLPNEDRWEQVAWYESQVSPPQAVWEQPADRCNKMYRIVDGDDGDRWPKTATMSRRRPCPEDSVCTYKHFKGNLIGYKFEQFLTHHRLKSGLSSCTQLCT